MLPPAAIVHGAGPDDVPGFLALAAEVEPWFGPMLGVLGFHEALDRNVCRGTALCVRQHHVDEPDGAGGPPGLFGGVFFSLRPHACRLSWLVVAAQARGTGVGRALVDAVGGRVDRPGVVDVVTFSADHPAAGPSGARAFYAALGFVPQGPAEPGSDGTPRQWFRRLVT